MEFCLMREPSLGREHVLFATVAIDVSFLHVVPKIAGVLKVDVAMFASIVAIGMKEVLQPG